MTTVFINLMILLGIEENACNVGLGKETLLRRKPPEEWVNFNVDRVARSKAGLG